MAYLTTATILPPRFKKIKVGSTTSVVLEEIIVAKSRRAARKEIKAKAREEISSFRSIRGYRIAKITCKPFTEEDRKRIIAQHEGVMEYVKADNDTSEKRKAAQLKWLEEEIEQIRKVHIG